MTEPRHDPLAADTPRHANALAGQSSPYLLQHAHNPVDWHPWGPEAFELARRTGRPIFLSIGYSTCYWCHVMERQSFEKEDVARVMNDHFVNIKVDREERPDVDDIYMAALQAFSGSGGWPMSVFLTPPGARGQDDRGLEPFFAGTYYPPEPMYNRPSFTQLLTGIADAWANRRDEILQQAAKLTDAVSHLLSREPAPAALNLQTVQDAANQILRGYDAEHGGFGSAPKFPTPNHLLFLLRVQEANPSDTLRQAIDHTLDRMARGGMYDQVGGGFHRYSTDAQWLVPHFEKMLYDQGQLVELYLAAGVPDRQSPNASDPGLYHRIARQTCDYVLREMTDPTGTFWSAQDAEVDAREGANYVWDEQQVRQAVKDPVLADLAVRLYGLNAGPNFRDPHDADAPPANVLHLPQPLDEAARQQRVALEEMVNLKASIDRRLLAVRNQRKQPGTDDKVLTPWNGLMIAALARAGRDLDEPRYTDAAARAARYILDRMRTEQGGLYHTMRGDSARIPAFLEGYAQFVHGMVELYRTQRDQSWLDAAEALTWLAAELFGHEQGGYHDTTQGQLDLLVRTRSTYDGAIPSGNSQMVHNLVDLYELTGDERCLDRAGRDLGSFASQLAREASGMAHMQHALLRVASHRPDWVQAGDARQAQGRRQVVNVTMEPTVIDVSAGAAEARITLDIGPDYHLNAADINDSSLIPTRLELLDVSGLELRVKYPSGTSRRYPMSDQPLMVYEGQVTFEATIRPTGQVSPGSRPRLVLSYQVCTDMTCLEPRTVDLPAEFRLPT